MTQTCEAHADCREPVVAKVGLPRAGAQWVCEEGFNEFQGNPRCDSTVGGIDVATGARASLRCKLRAGHEEESRHRSGTTTW